jgi:hypothetical protein
MEVFALFYCDAWKTPGSMRLAGIYDNITTMKKHIRTARNNGDMKFDADLDVFRTIDELNTILVFGHIERRILNEIYN